MGAEELEHSAPQEDAIPKPNFGRKLVSPRALYALGFIALVIVFQLMTASQVSLGYLEQYLDISPAAFSPHRTTPKWTAETAPRPHRDKQSEKPLNIVLFYADDWTMNVLGKLNPDVHTPHIDQMADKGVLFLNSCVITSMCWISRASLVTGVYASRHLELEPSGMELFETHPWNQTLFPLLRQHGYYTGVVGKWHAPQPYEEMKQAFDYSNFYFGDHYMERNGKMRHVTDLNREDALFFLQNRPRKQNFFLKVSFFATHALDGQYPSFEPKNESMGMYQNTTIPVPKTATEQHWKDMPFFFQEDNEGRNRWRKRFEPDYFQDNVKDVYRMAHEVDAAVGEIIQELKVQGVYNTTLLIFTTDNGNLMGEHGLAEKWYPLEESIRVPLVIQDPRMPRQVRGTTSKLWALNIDLTPTILQAAKITPSNFMQGRDLAHLYLDKDITWRKDWFYEYNRGDPVTAKGHPGEFWIDASFALVTKDWKYVYWPQHKYEQLFHRSLDPFEEWDTLHTNLSEHTIQTTDTIYKEMKARYRFLKKRAQSGKSI